MWFQTVKWRSEGLSRDWADHTTSAMTSAGWKPHQRAPALCRTRSHPRHLSRQGHGLLYRFRPHPTNLWTVPSVPSDHRAAADRMGNLPNPPRHRCHTFAIQKSDQCQGIILSQDLRSLPLSASDHRQGLRNSQQPREKEMKADSDIKRDVEAELKWDPDIDPTDIAVAVKDGVVTLTGFVRSYTQKWQAERDVERVLGVVGVANDIEVRIPTSSQRPDPEIARGAVAALKHELPYSSENMKVIVKDGWVTLEGTAEWNYQRTRAEEAVRRISGIKGVSDLILLKPRVAPSEIKAKIEEAFRRSAEVDAGRITVEANGGEVILKGSVRSWAERREASVPPGGRRASPGSTTVSRSAHDLTSGSGAAARLAPRPT